MKAPKPINDGSKIMCPMVDVSRIEAMPADQAAKLSAGELFCSWERDLSPEALEDYERHFHEVHWKPFVAESHEIIRRVREWEQVNGLFPDSP